MKKKAEELQAPEEQPRKKRGQLYLGLVCGLLIGCLVFGLLSLLGLFRPEQRWEGEGFASPQEAVQSYLEAMARGDLDAMLACYAIETRAEHFDYQAQLEQLGALVLSSVRLPTDGEYNRQICQATMAGEAAQRARIHYYIISLGADAELFSQNYVKLEDDDAARYALRLGEEEWLDSIGGLQIGQIRDLSQQEELQQMLGSESWEKQLRKSRAAYGFDELALYCAEFETDYEDYRMAFDLYCYDGAWYIADIGGVAASLCQMDAACYGLQEQ